MPVRVRSGETVVIFGPEGSGKTNLLQSVFSRKELNRPEELIQYDMSFKRGYSRDQIGYLPRDYAGFPQLTVKENLAIMARMFSRGTEPADLIEKFNLQLIQKRKLKGISKEEKTCWSNQLSR